MKLIDVTPASWLVEQLPSTRKFRTPQAIAALEKAVEAVDRDISAYGHVTIETVDKCRDALALARGQIKK